jgi:hypothetical protein
MKKILTYISLTILGLASILTTGCSSLTPSQVNTAALLLQQASYQGAAYAIKQDTNNAKWFALADSSIKTFATGQDLSPAAFELQLASISPQLQNQWVQLAIDTTIVTYDGLYGQYVISQVNSNAVAKQFLTSITTGFDQALGTNTVTASPTTLLLNRGSAVARPSIVKVKK